MLSPAVSQAAVIDVIAIPPGEIIDLEVGSGGSVYLLRSGIPHLVILDGEGGTTELDLEDISVPGGMCLVDGWGFFVSDALSGRIVRFGGSGEVLDELSAPGRPGDVVRDGLELWYVSRDEGTVRSAGDPGVVLFNTPSSGPGRLSVADGTFLFSEPAGAWTFRTGEPAVQVAAGGPAVVTRRGVFSLGEGIVATSRGDTLASYGSGDWERISASPDGRTIVLWRRSGPSALVIR